MTLQQILKIMYYPFLQNDFSSFFYFYNNSYDLDRQQAERPVQCIKQPISPTNITKIEERDAEDMEYQITGNISVTVKDLREAGYEKKKQAWSEEQDAKLLTLVSKKLRWIQIADEMEGRSVKMCYSRYKRLESRNDEKRGFWSNQQDKRLVELVNLYGQNWKELSIYFQNRKPKQLRERYINALTPNISKQPWTLEQDLKLIELYNMFGKKWKNIAEELQCRSENQVKNRFYGRILPIEMRKTKTDA